MKFENFTTKDGLISNEVYNLHQDKEGHIWIFSKFGTLKYNGKEFKQVLTNLGINDRFIFTIHENDKGEKWVANSTAKIYKIRNDSAIIIKGIEYVSETLRKAVSEIVEMSVDDSLNIYAITKGLSFKLINQYPNYSFIDLSATIQKDTFLIKGFQVGNKFIYLPNYYNTNEFIYMGGVKRNFYLKLFNNGNIFLIDDKPYEAFFRHLKKIGNDFYFLIGKSIGKITNGQLLSYFNIGSTVLNYTKDKNNHLWVGTFDDGLYEINENDSIIAHYLDNLTVNDVLVDHQSGVWASTTTKGLFHCSNLNASQFKSTQSLSGNINVLKKINNSLFIGTSRGDVYSSINSNLNLIKLGKNEALMDIESHNKDLIMSMNYKVEKWTNSLIPKIKSVNERTEKFYQVISKSSDTVIYVWRRGISFAVNNQFEKRIDYELKIQTAELIDNKIWLGTDDGVYIANSSFEKRGKIASGVVVPEKIHLNRNAFLLPTKGTSVSKIAKDVNNIIWFSTLGHGFYALKDGKLKSIDGNVLPTDIIFDVYFTKDSLTFISTNRGLFVSKNFTFEGQKVRWECLYQGEVRKAIQFKGNLYLSTNEGLVIIKYSKNQVNNENVFFNLSNILIDAKETIVTDFKQMESHQNSIEFKFEEVTFSNNRSIIKYLLNGPIIDSGLVSNYSVKFSRLLPGEYILSAYLIRETDKSVRTISVPFSVLPQFWQTWYFKLSIFAIIVLITFLIVRLIIRQNKIKEEIKTQNERLIIEYKLIALKAQINPHFISNCLSSIQNLINKNKETVANFYISQFGLLVRQILDCSTRSVITLEEELNIIKIYVALEQLRFANTFKFELKLQEDLSPKTLFVPPLILNPIVENAIWHGLLPKEEQNTCSLTIKVTKGPRLLQFVVIDNGVGRSYKNENKIKKTHSYGINITEQRLSNMNYLYNTNEATMKYSDLFDSNHVACGTTVELNLPIILNPEKNEKN